MIRLNDFKWFLFLSLMIVANIIACETVVLKDVPIYKELFIGEERVCVFEVSFLTGGKGCLAGAKLEEYEFSTKPLSFVLPLDTYEFLFMTTLKACEMAGRNKFQACSHDIKLIDGALRELVNLSSSGGNK